MTGNLAQFGEDLRLHLARLQVSVDNINGLFTGLAMADEGNLASRLDELRATTTRASERAAELHERLQTGLEREATLEPETLARWVGRRQTAQLHARADLIEQLAVVAVELAALCGAEAERIAMTAIMARQQAVAVQVRADDQL
ncbi:hypothetical protein [Bradyrhizobium sp. F1.13.3]|uniref:hypothetical protein n=1 Tax=Bradyrhizobium sp. F1.13.3 TaxID=3156351 RepID=UPI003392EC5E